MLGRAVGAGRHGRGRRLRRADEPDGRVQLPRARAPRRRPVRVPLHEPRVSGGGAVGAGAERGRDALRARRLAARRGRVRARDRRGLPARWGAHPVRRDEARGRAAGRGVRRLVRRARRDRSLRRDRRAVADGQGRPGRVHALAARPPARAAAHLHRLWGYREAGARPAPRRRPLRPDPRAARRPRGVGRGDRQRRRRRRGQPVAAGDDGAVPRADRPRGADRAGGRGAAGRRAALRVGLPRAVRAHGVAAGARAAHHPRGHVRVDRGQRAVASWRRWADDRDRRSPPPPGRAPARRRVGRARRPAGRDDRPGPLPRPRDELLLRRVELRARAARVGLRRAAQAAQRAPLDRPGADLQGAVLDARDRLLHAVPRRRRGRAPDRAGAAVPLRAQARGRPARARRRGPDRRASGRRGRT